MRATQDHLEIPARERRLSSHTNVPPSNTNVIIDSQLNVTEPDLTQPRFNTFTLFPKLPIELRLSI
jgi:hypothetical protein